MREAGGYPINLAAVAEVLAKADEVLEDKGGRDYTGPLTFGEVEDLGFVIS